MVSAPQTTESRLDSIARSIRSKLAQSARNAIVIGLELIEAREIIGHGFWAEWLQNEFEWGDRTARRYIQAAETFGKSDKLSNFKIQKQVLYLVSADSTPDEAKEEVVSLLEQGQTVSIADAREIVAKHKQTVPPEPKTVVVTEETSPLYRKELQVVGKRGGMIECQDEAGNTVGVLANWVDKAQPQPKPAPQPVQPKPNHLAEVTEEIEWLTARVQLLEQFIGELLENGAIAPAWVDKARELVGD